MDFQRGLSVLGRGSVPRPRFGQENADSEARRASQRREAKGRGFGPKARSEGSVRSQKGSFGPRSGDKRLECQNRTNCSEQ